MNRADVRIGRLLEILKPNVCTTPVKLNKFVLATVPGRHAFGVALPHADLRHANLHASKLVGVDLSRAMLDGSDLSNAFLTGVDLSHASMTGANTSGMQRLGTDQ